jgi:multidrug resistance efflux pump
MPRALLKQKARLLNDWNFLFDLDSCRHSTPLNNALSEKQRREKLYAAGVISREDLERYTREYDVAKARYQESAERQSLVDDHAREEDIAFAQADLRLARAHQAEAQASTRRRSSDLLSTERFFASIIAAERAFPILPLFPIPF